jgi:hypothetical protein
LNFFFEILKKKIWANFQRITELITLKIVTKLSKIWVWDPGSADPEWVFSGIQDPEKTHSGFGSRGQKGTGSRIRNTATAPPLYPFMVYLSGVKTQNLPLSCIVLKLLD